MRSEVRLDTPNLEDCYKPVEFQETDFSQAMNQMNKETGEDVNRQLFMQNSRRLAHPRKDVSTCSCQMTVDMGFGENISEEALGGDFFLVLRSFTYTFSFASPKLMFALNVFREGICSNRNQERGQASKRWEGDRAG